jgi:phosphoesterase RecJ-like protein
MTETSVALSTREQVLSAVTAGERFALVTHENLDGDALGSLVAMHALLRELDKDAVIVIAPEEFPLPPEYRFLALDGLCTAPPKDLDRRTAIFLDCGNLDRNPLAAMRAAQPLINIDHHHDNTRFGTVNYVEDAAACTAEIVWLLAGELGVTITRPIAEALYVGLITDTGCFMYENTTARAHLMAAELIGAGVDVHGIYQHVYEGVPFAKLALLARGLQRTERFDDGRLTLAQLTAEDFDAAGAQESYTEGVVDHLRAVRGTKMAALVRDRLAAPGEAAADAGGARLRKVSLRASDPAVDVSAIARAQGGGGHRAAAGFTTSLSWDELVAFLRSELAGQLERS